MEELQPGDLVLVNDDTWLYGGETFMEFRIATTIKKGTLGVVVGMQSSEGLEKNSDMIQFALVSFPGWIGWAHVEFLGKVEQ